MTNSEKAKFAHDAAAALVILDRDAEAKMLYNEAARLYAAAGEVELAGFMRDCADAI